MLQTLLVGCLATALFTVFVGLGIWQIERRDWKLDLIAAVEERANADSVKAPMPEAWPDLSFEGDEYRRVTLAGRFLAGADTLARATTDYGYGYWLMTPLNVDGGYTAFINRGFVPSREIAGEIAPPAGDVVVTGLLRMSQPGGGFLRSNDPAAGRWYSRDVEAMAEAEGISLPVAPFFVDAETPVSATSSAEWHVAGSAPTTATRYPIAGLTVTSFRNSHLVYALTWLALAALTLLGAAILVRRRMARGKGR
ncbi:SURF1 family protein [Fulvimarina pelagi]|nr:SURF1 family protein [Fulvimarina pelagi]